MEKFLGRAHLPGSDKEWGISLDVDWDEKEIYVHGIIGKFQVRDFANAAVLKIQLGNGQMMRECVLTDWWYGCQYEDCADIDQKRGRENENQKSLIAFCTH